MRVETSGDPGEDLVLVLGWGNRHHHENVQWLVEQFVTAGYHVHTFQIQDVVTDYEREYVRPVREYVDDLSEFRLVGHSTGGLVGSFIEGATTRTYLSPWWGFPDSTWWTLLSLVARLPTSKSIIPTGDSPASAIGERATEAQLQDGPKRAAPSFFGEIRRAHEERPPVDDDAVVFCSLQDKIVSVQAIGRAVSTDQVVLYDGGHELFSSRSREKHADTLRDAAASGRDGLTEA